MRPNAIFRLGPAVLVGGGVVYPLLVYFGLPYVSPGVLVLVALGLLALRMLAARREAFRHQWTPPLLVSGIALAILAAVSPSIAVRAYPVLVSVAAACVFGASLLSPPTVVERIARMTTPDLSPEGVVYTRAVTQIWTLFLAGNGSVAAALAVWGTVEQWTLWTGLVSYLLMGFLFAGERVVRRFYLRQA
ncbi:MAG: hypothetical protein ACM30I_17665 [Gemmatimonas sp.]